MIVPSGAVRVLVATRPVDFCKGMDGLAALVRESLGSDPYSGCCCGTGKGRLHKLWGSAPAPLRACARHPSAGCLNYPCRTPRQRCDQVDAANAVRLQLHALAYNLGNFLRTLATPEPIKDWSLTSLKEKLIKIGAKVVSHGRYVVFQMAEVAIPRQMFQEILRLIAELRPQPPPAPA